MSEPTLHPNLAKLASAYDAVLERHSRGQIGQVQARAEIAQLETRDDQGVRWSIDPDSGEWVRKTALGDVEFDSAPPAYGYMTPDAFDYTAAPQVYNPADRIQLAAVDAGLTSGPIGLAGATRSLTSAPNAADRLRAQAAGALGRLRQAPGRTKAVVGVGVVGVLFVALHGCGSSAPASTPIPMRSPAVVPHKVAPLVPHHPVVHVSPARH